MKIVDMRKELPKHQLKSYKERPLSAVTKVAIHHSLTDNIPGNKDIFAFARYHIETLDWPGIGYHYVIDADGTIYKCNPATVKSYHVGKHNYHTLGVCLVGDFRNDKPTREQSEALEGLLVNLATGYNIKPENVLGHSEFSGYEWKKCPCIDMDKIRKSLKERIDLNGMG